MAATIAPRVLVDAAVRGQDKLLQRQRRLFRCSSGKRRNGAYRRQESADSSRAPPLRIAPARPGYVRHAPSPLLAAAISPAPSFPPLGMEEEEGESPRIG